MDNTTATRNQLKQESAEARRLRNESERDLARKKAAETTEKLRALRLARESEEASALEKGSTAKKAADKKGPGRLPQVHRR